MARQRPGDESSAAPDEVTGSDEAAPDSAVASSGSSVPGSSVPGASGSGFSGSAFSGSGVKSSAADPPDGRGDPTDPGTPAPETPPPDDGSASKRRVRKRSDRRGRTGRRASGTRIRTITRTRRTREGSWLGYTTTRRQLAWLVTGVLALAIVLAVVLISRGDEPEPDAGVAFGDLETVVDEPVGLTEDQLRGFGAEHDGPVYWAGPRAGTTYELTVTSGGDIFVRYLPPGVAVGTEQADYLTVATYTRPAAYEALREVATGSTFTSEDTASGALVVYAATDPTSAHFSFPDTDLQVEVYEPEPDRAVELVLDGSITLLR